MSDLTDFLLARIAEDEAVARTAAPDEYTPPNGYGYDARGAARPVMSRSRVLAECEAKRALVEMHTAAAAEAIAKPAWGPIAITTRAVLVELASVYADHPSFREEWRP